MFEHIWLPLMVLELLLLELVFLIKWSVQEGGLLGCVLGWAAGMLWQIRMMRHGHCAALS